MYSFYGGRPGNPFVIVTTFRSVDDMVNEFKKGPEYTAVHYDEHVMINTVNKNDPNNGKIYRRGYDFTNDVGGAEYIGTIVGPSGRAPMLELTDLQTAISKSSTEENFEEKSSEKRIAEGTYNIANGSLVPGKYVVQETDMQGNPKQDDQGNPIYISKYNDEIKWVSCSIRNENNEDCTAYIGFKIPYPVFEISSESVEPYNNNNKYEDKAAIDLIDGEEHPFYKKWNLKIPKGIKGDSVGKISVQTVTNDSNIMQYDHFDDDKRKGYKVLTYQKYNYDMEKNPQPEKYYLGDYNVIDSVTNDNGKITIKYTHAEPTVINVRSIENISLDQKGLFTLECNDGKNITRQLKQVKEIKVDENNGINVEYSNGETSKIGSLKSIEDIKIEDGKLKYRYNDSQEYTESSGILKWVTGISMPEPGKMVFTYNQGAPTTEKIKWPMEIYTSGNQTRIRYSDGKDVQLGTITSITGATLSDGILTIRYTHGNDSNFPIPMLANNQAIVLDELTGKITAEYAGVQNPVTIGAIKWPTGASINENSELLINWRDSNASQNNYNTSQNLGKINSIVDVGINDDGNLLIKNSDPNKNDSSITFKNSTGWQDLGNIIPENIRYEGNSVGNVNWTGIGYLQNTGSEGDTQKVIKFTLVPNQLLNNNFNNVRITSGAITVIKRGESAAITNFNNAELTQKDATVTKTFAGIDFEIPSGIPSDTNAAPEFVDIIIQGLSLEFS